MAEAYAETARPQLDNDMQSALAERLASTLDVAIVIAIPSSEWGAYPKSTRANIRADELKALRKLADQLLNYSAKEIATSVKAGALIEAKCDDDEVQDAKEAPD